MQLEDIPFLRAFPVLFGLAKVVLLLAALFIVPLVTFVAIYQYIKATTVLEKWYFAIKSIGWFFGSWVLWMVAITFIFKIFDGPDISGGENFPYYSALFGFENRAQPPMDALIGILIWMVSIGICSLLGSETNDGFCPR